MGAFGIYVAILTFIYIVYYAAMIGMDVVGSNGKKKVVSLFMPSKKEKDKDYLALTKTEEEQG